MTDGHYKDMYNVCETEFNEMKWS